ncbi:MAG: UPF0175 family protein, partial [Nitrospirota bacterium]|nr:UPF0175 family protein [Nitrospirota bacterium]
GIISQEKTAEIAGLTRAEFIFSLSRFNVSPFQYTPEEIEEDLSKKKGERGQVLFFAF